MHIIIPLLSKCTIILPRNYSTGVTVTVGEPVPVNGRLFKKLTLLLAINQASTKIMAMNNSTKK